jgi:hypothetical protein
MGQPYHHKSCCWFFRSGSGCNTAGGCTKAFLDTHHGDVSLVMGPNGQPKQDRSAVVTNHFETETADLTASGLDSGVLAGLIARISDSFCEVIGTGPDTVRVNRWAGTCTTAFAGSNGTNSLIYVDDDSIYSVGGDMHVKGTIDQLGDGTYQILAINFGEIEIADGTAVANYNGGGMYCAPAIIEDGHVVIGGAYNDLQDVLDVSDAVYHDQWIFFNEDIEPTQTTSGSAYHIYATHDGEGANNTKLYIVGYNTDAYDCLPDGFGYFPAGTQNTGIYYRTALARAKNSSDAAIKADLPTVSAKYLTGDWDRLFRVYVSSENIQFMGMYLEAAIQNLLIMSYNQTTGSVFIKHCAAGHLDYDAAPNWHGANLLTITKTATGGGILDCFLKGVSLVYGLDPTTNLSGDWEFAYNVGIHTDNITSEYSGTNIHHNIFVKCLRAATVSTRSFLNIYNNIFYHCREAGFVLAGTEGRLRAWNNIVVMDEADPDFEGLIRVGTGGTVDYFDYNCYCNRTGQPVSVFEYDAGSNPDFNFVNLKKGAHDIEAAPRFIDPDNWDFRLRPNSPCLQAGRPDVQDSLSNIGPYSHPDAPGLYGKTIPLYGN